MSWNCEQVEARLGEYVDQLLSEEERAAFAGHAEQCPRCAPLVAQVSQLVAQLRQWEPVEAPPRLVYRILDQTLGPRHAKPAWPAWLGWMPGVLQPRFAMGVVTVALGLVVMTQALGINWREVRPADLHPANLYRAADRRVHLLYARGVKFVNDLRVVYEIQTRLEPQPERPPTPQPAPGSTGTTPQQNRERDMNRADELKSVPVMLASAPGGVPGGSLRFMVRGVER